MVSWGPSSKRSLCQHLLAASNFRSSLAFSFPPLLGETAFHPTPTLLCSCWFLLLSCVSSSQSSQTTPLLFVLCYVRETAHAFCSLLKSHRTSSSGKARQAPVQHKPWPNPAHQIATTGSASGLSAGKYPRSKLEAWLLFSVIKLAFFFFLSFFPVLQLLLSFLMCVISVSHWEIVDRFAIIYVQPDQSVFKLACLNFEIIMMSVAEIFKTNTLY